MTRTKPTPEGLRTEQALKMALLGVVGQVGCLTLLIVLVSVVVGLWLDGQFHTRPLFTLVLVLGSVPVTLFVMFRVVLSAAPRLQTGVRQGEGEATKEAPDRGERETG
jgi:hypothetical protein